MGQTQIYGLPWQALTDAPHGPNLGQDLADAVETELARIDTDVADVDSRLTVVEGQGVPAWVKIQEGANTGTTFVISGIPTGTYSRLRLTMFGGVESATNPIRIRVNGDATTDLHRSGRLVYDAAGTLIENAWADDTFWNLGQWGTAEQCSAVVEMWPTDVTEQVSFIAELQRIGGSATAHTRSHSWGQLNSALLVDSLRVSGPSGFSFTACRWWLEGVPA